MSTGANRPADVETIDAEDAMTALIQAPSPLLLAALMIDQDGEWIA